MLRWDGHGLEAVLLDLDDTILDGRSGLDAAWDQVSYGLAERLGTVSPGAVRAQLRISSDWYWGDDERHRCGRLDLPRAREALLAHVLESLGRPDPRLAADMAETYCRLREAQLAPFPGALEALSQLRARMPALGLVTNGAAAAQRAKIERWGLAEHFDVVAIEGEVGAGKPDARHFGHALDALGVDPAATLMAGDNYACDVLGALRLGLHAVWIDRERRPEPPVAPPRPHRTLPSFVALVDALAG
jgi:putative hydrolase of the HAD superfamily